MTARRVAQVALDSELRVDCRRWEVCHFLTSQEQPQILRSPWRPQDDCDLGEREFCWIQDCETVAGHDKKPGFWSLSRSSPIWKFAGFGARTATAVGRRRGCVTWGDGDRTRSFASALRGDLDLAATFPEFTVGYFRRGPRGQKSSAALSSPKAKSLWRFPGRSFSFVIATVRLRNGRRSHAGWTLDA